MSEKAVKERFFDIGEAVQTKAPLRYVFEEQIHSNADYTYDEALSDIRQQIIDGKLDLDLTAFNEAVEYCRPRAEDFVKYNQQHFTEGEAGTIILYTYEMHRGQSMYSVMNKVLTLLILHYATVIYLSP